MATEAEKLAGLIRLEQLGAINEDETKQLFFLRRKQRTAAEARSEDLPSITEGFNAQQLSGLIRLEQTGDLTQDEAQVLRTAREEGKVPPEISTRPVTPGPFEAFGGLSEAALIGLEESPQGPQQIARQIIGAIGDDPGLAEQFTEQVSAERERTGEERLSVPIPGAEIARGVGRAVPATAGAIAAASTLPVTGPLVTGALVAPAIGAVEGATEFVEPEQSRLINTLIGGGAGAVFGGGAVPIARGAKDVVGRFGGRQVGEVVREQVVDPAKRSVRNAAVNIVNRLRGRGAGVDELTDDAIRRQLREDGQTGTISLDDVQKVRAQVRESVRGGPATTPDETRRLEDFETLGIEPTRGQVSGDPRQFAFEQNIAGREGVGEPLQERFTEQAQKLAGGIEDVGVRTGGVPEEAFTTGETLQTVARQRADDLQVEVSDAYKKAGTAEGADLDVPVEDFSARFDDIFDVDEDVLPPGIVKRVREMVDPESDRVFTIREIEKTRKLINRRIGESANKSEKRALGDVLGAMDDAIARLPGDVPAAMAAKDARALASERFSTLSPKLVGDLLDPKRGTAAESFVKNKVMSGKIDDVRQLKEFAQESPAGEQAFRNVQRQVVEQLRQVADPGLTGKRFQFNQFSKRIENMGPTRLRTIFGEEDAAQLERLARVSRDVSTQPTGSRVNRSNTAVSLMNGLDSILQRIPVVKNLLAPQLVKRAAGGVARGQDERAVQEALDRTLRPRGPRSNLFEQIAAASGAGGALATEEVAAPARVLTENLPSFGFGAPQ